MKSAGQVRHEATIDERKRLNLVIDTQITLLWDRVAAAKTDDIKSAWTIAILELTEVKKLVNYPTVGIPTEYQVKPIMSGYNKWPNLHGTLTSYSHQWLTTTQTTRYAPTVAENGATKPYTTSTATTTSLRPITECAAQSSGYGERQQTNEPSRV